MNHRLTIAAAVAVILASTSEWVLISGGAWLGASIGAVIVMALAGTLTRLAPTQAAVGATVLATVACVPLLADRSLYLKLAGLVVIGCCAASASRVRLLRPVADLVTYLSALLLYLNLTLASGKSFALLVPTAKSLRHLVTLMNQGSALAKNSPPVTGSSGVILLAAASIGLAAIVVDVLAVRLRKPAIAGLPLLVIYMAPIATAAKTGGPSSIITFLLAAVGYLALLASDGRHRLRGWGRIVTVWHYAGEDERLGGADIRGLAATGRRIGFAAICAAIVAPLLLPSLNLQPLFGDHGGGDHVVQAGLPNPIDQMHALLNETNNAPVLSYTSTAKAGQYLQVYVDNYNQAQSAWTIVSPTPSVSVGQTALLSPQGLAGTTQYSTVVTTIKLDHVVGASLGYNFPVFFLPVPYWPTGLSLAGSWKESYNSLMVYSGIANHSGTRYTVTSGQPVLSRALEALPESIPGAIKKYLGFRSSVTSKLTTIAQDITGKATTPFQRAQALEAFFQTGKFHYTLRTDVPNTAQGLLDFLTTDRRGFCEQFAFAMAVLARLVGIPSRIAVGYTGGTKKADGTWQVTTSDAHSWPELYFSQIGWLRFEPTPGGPRGQGTASVPSYATPSGSIGTIPPIPTRRSGPIPNNGVEAVGTHVKAPAQDQVGRVTPTLPPTRHTPAPVGQILLGLLALLVVAGAVPGIARIVSRRRRWRAAVDDTTLAKAAWQEVCADLEDYGLTRRLSESPRATARRMSADANIDEGAKRAIGRIATVVERCRYAPVPASADGIRADVTEVRRSLARNSDTIQRLRARLMPASVTRPMFDAAQRTLGQRTGWVPSPVQG